MSIGEHNPKHQYTPDPIQVLFIAGWGRSGSTLLDMILGQVPGFVSVGELKFVWERGVIENRRCSCGDSFASCPFWKGVMEELGPGASLSPEQLKKQADRLRTRHLPLILVPGSRRIVASRLRSYSDSLVGLYRSIMQEAAASTVVDSSKFPSYLFLLGTIPEIDVRVLHLLRDPRAVAYAWTKRKEDPDAPGGGLMKTLPPALTGAYWSAWNLSIERVSRSQGLLYRQLRYEEFVEEPEAVLKEALALLGFTGLQLPLNGRRLAGGRHHLLSGNPMRLERSGEVEILSDRAWESEMPHRDRTAAWLSSWPTRLRYGYD